VLRKRFILVLSPLVVLLTITAVAAIWILQSFVVSLHTMDSKSWTCIEHVNNLSITLGVLERGVTEDPPSPANLTSARQTLKETYARFNDCYNGHMFRESATVPAIRTGVDALNKGLATLIGTTQVDPNVRRQMLRSTSLLQEGLVDVTREIRTQAEVERAEYISRFRAIVLGLAAVFVVLINLSVIAFLRTAGMILRPVEKLIEATRQLGQEHFDHRVELDHEDEFAELARAYNNMAGQLQSSEQRQLDTLQRVALTLNHELNNALAAIELQLQLLNRKGGTVDSARNCAGQIREGLARMGATVEALKHVRRIVLTDYLPGVKMLDLEKSVRDRDEALVSH
jgi:signal transduction histidine kinase